MARRAAQGHPATVRSGARRVAGTTCVRHSASVPDRHFVDMEFSRRAAS